MCESQTHRHERRTSMGTVSDTSDPPSTVSRDSTSSSCLNKRARRDSASSSLTAQGNKRQFVEHNYHDHAHEDLGSSVAQATNAITLLNGKVKGRFPLLLHQMLETAEQENKTWIMGWQSHGRTFKIHERERFVQEYLPRFGSHNNYKSFRRQLNLYGFKQLARDGPDQGSYYHELFLQGKALLSLSMERLNINGKGIRTSSSPDTEPNFQNMPPVSRESALEEYLRGVDLYSSGDENDTFEDYYDNDQE